LIRSDTIMRLTIAHVVISLLLIIGPRPSLSFTKQLNSNPRYEYSSLVNNRILDKSMLVLSLSSQKKSNGQPRSEKLVFDRRSDKKLVRAIMNEYDGDVDDANRRRATKSVFVSMLSLASSSSISNVVNGPDDSVAFAMNSKSRVDGYAVQKSDKEWKE